MKCIAKQSLCVTFIFALVGALVACEAKGPPLPNTASFQENDYTGRWHSIGYGFLLDISDDGMSIFDISKDSCYQAPVSSHEIAAVFRYFRMLDDNTFEVSATKESTRYRFTKVKQYRTNCKVLSEFDPVLIFESFAKVMSEHYAFFDLYNVNWSERVAANRRDISKTTTEEELFSKMSSMLDGLEDAHLTLAGRVGGIEQTYKKGSSKTLRPALNQAFQEQSTFTDIQSFKRSWFEEYKRLIVSELLQGQKNNNYSDNILWGMVGNVGYINILRMSGFSENGQIQEEVQAVDSAMSAIMNHLSTTSTIIVDISANGGGEDEVGRTIAGYFTNKPVLGYGKSAYGTDLAQQNFMISPSSSNNYNGNVVVVTSNHTVSAAETFALAMRQIENVQIVGEVTRGALSDILLKHFTPGWYLGLSNEIYVDANGKPLEGIGIVPDKILPIFQNKNIHTSHFISVQALLNELQK